MKIRTRSALTVTLGLCVSFNMMAQKPADLVGTGHSRGDGRFQ